MLVGDFGIIAALGILGLISQFTGNGKRDATGRVSLAGGWSVWPAIHGGAAFFY
jgi:hypothetical protein